MADTADLEQDVTVPCRSCTNDMSVEVKTCPHCGTRAITRYEAAGIAVVGLVVAVVTALTGLWPITAIGVLVLLAGGALYRDRQQKLQRATV